MAQWFLVLPDWSFALELIATGLYWWSMSLWQNAHEPDEPRHIVGGPLKNLHKYMIRQRVMAPEDLAVVRWPFWFQGQLATTEWPCRVASVVSLGLWSGENLSALVSDWDGPLLCWCLEKIKELFEICEKKYSNPSPVLFFSFSVSDEDIKA